MVRCLNMAHGLNAMLKRGGNSDGNGKTGIGSRRIFAPQFKLQVLDSYRNDADCKGNQRATARKYGIHRRQIQKWLQVEANLRTSVLKSCASPEARKCGLELALSGDRQRDDLAGGAERAGVALLPATAAAAADKRVPDIPLPPPLKHEWRRASPASSSASSDTHSRCCFSPPAPLDFTTHSRRSPTPPPPEPAAPIDLSLKRRRLDSPSPVPAPASPPPPPFCLPPAHPDIWDLSMATKTTTSSSPRPIKLFKPYLDHVIEEVHSPTPAQFSPPVPFPSPVSPAASFVCIDAGDHYNIYHNNNNNNYQPDYQVDYALYNDYYYSGGGLHFVREPFPYKGATGCMKQRQSYSLDFKLSAIECYYSDAVCRGNQRAVASKFKIHRRQVQKWLKQEDQLRQRVQPLHIVR